MTQHARNTLVHTCNERLARCILTFCIDSADALMVALLKGATSATEVLGLLIDSMSISDTPSHQHACQELDRLFALGTAQWGCRLPPRGMATFHRHVNRWQSRVEQLPSWEASSLMEIFTEGGSQWVVIPSDEMWPSKLHDLTIRSDWAPPLCLWGLGEQSSLASCDAPISIVGSRAVSEYGRSVASSIAEHIASEGHTVISGGAMGTDASAHWGALAAVSQVGEEQAGRTLAIFAGGLNHIGPSCNQHLFQQIIANRGALISELCPNTIPEARRFLLRNRIIAALCSTLIVAQARLRSGALNTAHWAAELNREIYAVPGNITVPDHAGCNKLISQQQAMLLLNTDSTQFCHKPHAPHHLQNSEDSAHNDVQDNAVAHHTDYQEHTPEAIIIRTIQTLQRNHHLVTIDVLFNTVHSTYSELFPNYEAIYAVLGLLELNGRVTTRCDSIELLS